MESITSLPDGEILKSIYSAHIFSGIGINEAKMLAHKSVISQCQIDDIIIEQGDIADKLYIIISGSMLVSVKDINVGRRKINILRAGDVFGEIAILRKIPRTARVSALTHCVYLTINGENFFSAYQYFPPRARDNIQLVIAKRLQELAFRSH